MALEKAEDNENRGEVKENKNPPSPDSDERNENELTVKKDCSVASTQSLKQSQAQGNATNLIDSEPEGRTNSETCDTTFFFLHYDIFCLLFMLGFMIHSRKYFNHEVRVAGGHVLAYAVLIGNGKRTYHPWVFASFLFFTVHSAISISPFGANHHNLMGFLSLLLLPQQLWRCWFGHGAQLRRVLNLTQNTLNVVRLTIIIMYLMAGFHKLNTDFFNPSVSCAYHMISDYFDVFGIEWEEQMPWWLEPLPYMVIVVEFLPPTLLLFRTTQQWGILLLLKLHLLLLFVGFGDFGSIAMSLLWLFTPTSVAHTALPLHVFTDAAVAFCVLETAAVILWYQRRGRIESGDLAYDPDAAPLEREEAVMVFVTYSIVWAAIFRAVSKSTGWGGPRVYPPKHVLGIFVLSFFIWFTMNPYFGLRTTGTVSMFSNLRTEGPTSNHLLLGSNPLKVFGYQEDLVEIIDCTTPWGEEMKPGHIVNRIVFENELRKEKEIYAEPDVFLKIIYNGNEYESDDVNNDHVFDMFRQPPPLWIRKYMDFRLVQREGPQQCVW